MFEGLNLKGFSFGGSAAGTAPAERPAAGRRPRLGLALGGGAARGWAHIGALRVLIAEGIMPDVVVGTSIGAVVGGCLVTETLDALEAFARGLNKRRVVGLLDFHIGGSGLIAGDRLRRMLDLHLARTRIENLPVRFAAVAAELGTGHEVWLTRGYVTEAVRASYALPGIFDPVKLGGRWLMDGALVNPIPITAARALGAEFVICINLSGNLRTMRGTTIPSHGPDDEAELIVEAADETSNGFLNAIGAARRIGRFGRREDGAPGIGTVMIDAFNITQDRIARARLAGDPPDVMIAPRLARIGLFDFHRAEEAIELGAEAAQRALPDLREMLSDLAATAER